MTKLVTLSSIREAAARIHDVARLTPLVEPFVAGGPRVRLKCESFQPIGAFKIRGACNYVAQLPAEARARGLITYSSGNHGQAVAYVARRFGVPAVIVMPTTAPAVKADGARALGAEIIFEGTTTEHRRRRAEAEAHARGLTIVPPFDDDRIIAGQGTCGLEIVEEDSGVSAVFVPVGGGGLIAGVAAAVKQLRPSVRVVGVEPAGAAKMTAALAAGGPVTLERVESVADGLLPVRCGDRNFAHVREFVDAVVTVDDEAIAAAMAWIFRHARLVAEPSGAAALAAVLRGLDDEAARRPGVPVAILSGGNVAPDTFCRLIGGVTP